MNEEINNREEDIELENKELENQGEEHLEEHIEQNVEQKEEQPEEEQRPDEEHLEEHVEEHLEEHVEEHVEENVEENNEQQVEQPREENLEEHVEYQVDGDKPVWQHSSDGSDPEDRFYLIHTHEAEAKGFTVGWTEKHRLFPYPQNIMDMNPNLKQDGWD